MKFYSIKKYEESITYYSETEYSEEEFLMILRLGYENVIKKLYNFSPYDIEAYAVIFYEPLFNEWIEENTDLKMLKNDIEISLDRNKLEEKSSVYKELLEYAQ